MPQQKMKVFTIQLFYELSYKAIQLQVVFIRASIKNSNKSNLNLKTQMWKLFHPHSPI